MRRHGLAALRRWVTASLAIEAAQDAARSKRRLLERCPLAAAMKQEQEVAKAEQAERIDISRGLRSMLGGL